MNYELRTTNQHGLSSLLLLIMITLGVLIIWEINETANHYSLTGKQKPEESSLCPGGKYSGIPSDPCDTDEGADTGKPVCLTGEADNCNDTNDVFILDE